MAYKTKTGHVLLDPQEKRDKFFSELKTGIKRTNSGAFKLDENKKAIRLNREERAFRSGYISAQNDSANAYNAIHGKKKRKN